METKNELVKVVETSGVEAQTATTLKEKFLPFFVQAEEWKRKAESLIVTDASQVAEMKMARLARLALKEIRVNADKTRKELKEDSIRYGKAVQGVYNVIEYLITPIEKHLQEQEDFVIIAEAKRKAELQATREMELQPFAEFVPFGLKLGEMSEDDYTKTLNGAKLQLQEKIRLIQEMERIAEEKAKAEAEERERIKIENARLKAEMEAKEKQLAEERAKAEAERKEMEEKARKEREAKEKLEVELKAKAEAELKAKKEAEEKARKEREEKELAEKKAKAAPDKAKLNDFAKMLGELAFPEVNSEEAKKILSDAKTLITKVSTFIREKSSII